MHQYGGGPFKICDWADIVTAHLVAGVTVISTLQEEANKRQVEL